MQRLTWIVFRNEMGNSRGVEMRSHCSLRYGL